MKRKALIFAAVAALLLPAAKSQAQSCCSPGRFTITPDESLLGKSAPNFELKTLDGKKLALDSFKGKTLLLEFCSVADGVYGPLRLPVLKSLAERYKNNELAVLCLVFGGEEPANVEEVVKKFGLANTSLIVVPGDFDVAEKYNVKYLPASVLIGKDRKVKKIGTTYLQLAEVERALPEVLGIASSL
jgi:peroxiredoxin